MSYSDHVALVVLGVFLFFVVVLACTGLAMLVSDWRAARRHKRRITAIINVTRF